MRIAPTSRFDVHAIACLSLVLFLLAGCAATPTPRSQAAVNAFKLEAPCPATGASRGPCPGYVVDHIVPLCAGGPDKPANMQWQTVAEGKLKDREEVRGCRSAS